MDKKKILLVEDDKFTRELYEEVIKEAGYLVTTATNGEEGLDLIRRAAYDLILLDVMMPRMDGLEVLRSIFLMS
ncbi:MAG: DNA-binding response regulator VicR [Parcubacteria group bacterium GW2011_GWA1_36_12]|nr:MAG: DNA-binding response regulator VicR [Parcubacteria group bacterium GW2011_GWA1_36_12]